MAEKVVIRSSTIDKHGDFTPIEILQDYVAMANGEHKMRYLANHRRDIPPIGYFDNAEIIEKDNIHHVVIEPIEFSNRRPVEWDENLLIEDAGHSILFTKRDEDASKVMRIVVDKNNFANFEAFSTETGQKLIELYEDPISLEIGLRKNFLPDPQVIITLTTYYSIVYPLLKPFLSKIGEKFAEDIADDVYKLCKSKSKTLVKKITESIKLIRKDMIPKNKTLLTIFEIPGEPYVELQIKSDDLNKISKALSERKLSKVHQKITELQTKIDISEICFVFTEKDKWEFTHLITTNGESVGTKSAFKKRDKLITRINLSPTKAFSIGAEGVKFEKRKI